MHNLTTNSLTLYQDGLLTLRRESTSHGELTTYHLEHLSCDDPVIVCQRRTFPTKHQAIAALLEAVEWRRELIISIS